LEDFYTFDKLQDTPLKYFFTYQDCKGFHWGFDIRSLHKLLQNNNFLNPYTTEKIPDTAIYRINHKMEELRGEFEYEDIDNIVKRDHKSIIKQKVVDLFSDIEISGYPCQIDWFLTLSIRLLRELYKQLADLWDYRLQYHQDTKRRLIPPNGKLFTTPLSVIIHDYDKIEDIQELLLSDISKFKNIQNESDKKLGYMYFLICLGSVSPHCYNIHQEWISAINP
jgi:hypothetical protein